jgi:hypothetical protein
MSPFAKETPLGSFAKLWVMSFCICVIVGCRARCVRSWCQRRSIDLAATVLVRHCRIWIVLAVNNFTLTFCLGKPPTDDLAARSPALSGAALRLRLHPARRTDRLHLFRREPPEPGAGCTCGGPVELPRLLPERQRSIQSKAARPVQQALSGQRAVHGGQCVLGPLPRPDALGGGRERGRLA